MFEWRVTSHRARVVLGRVAVAAAAGGAAVMGTGALSAPAVPAVSQALHMQPAQLVGRLAPAGRSAKTTAAASSTCWQSANWSGYAVSTTSSPACVPASGVTYTSVSGTWTVPTVTGSGGGLFGRGSTYSAVWTGIDGFTDSSLIQAGTEQDVTGGTAKYQAWWEILPAAETPITSITVQPGDSITVTITKVSGSTWSISLTDNGKSGHSAQPTFTTTQSYSGSGTSAEWIVEAPEVNGRIATLANYGSTIFDLGKVNGASVVLPAGSGGEMVQSSLFSSTVESVPSSPDTGPPAGDGFACAYGSTAPPAPSS